MDQGQADFDPEDRFWYVNLENEKRPLITCPTSHNDSTGYCAKHI